jgi:hypothetical protein
MPTTTEPNSTTITLTLTGCEIHRRDPSTGLPLAELSRVLSLFELAMKAEEHEASSRDLITASLIVDWLTRWAMGRTDHSEALTATELATEIAEVLYQVRRREGQTSLETAAEIIELSSL